MKVIHIPFQFRPDPMGGTEVYVEALAREQLRRGMEVVVAAPGETRSFQMDAGLPVYRFAVSRTLTPRNLYGDGDSRATLEFMRVLDGEKPDIVHLHAFTSAVSWALTREVHQRDVPLVFTYHTPTVSCQRGTLLHWGRASCNGELNIRKCAGCTLHGLGLSRWVSTLLSILPSRLGCALVELGLVRGGWTALSMTELIRLRHEAIRGLMCEVDRVVVLCRWARELLLRNGVPAHKMVLSRHGVTARSRPRATPAAYSGTTRIAFLGRLHPTKGVDTLLRALESLPGVPLEIHLFGIPDDTDYGRSIQKLVDGDRRVTMLAPVSSAQVVDVLQGYDILAVPSRWLETGPLVVLEAFEAGIPVVGSRLGGIAELVTDGLDGFLVDANSVEAWKHALHRLATNPGLLAQLRAGVHPPRHIAQVADDMESTYRGLVA